MMRLFTGEGQSERGGGHPEISTGGEPDRTRGQRSYQNRRRWRLERPRLGAMAWQGEKQT